MRSVELWVWIGNSDTDVLDVLRYVRATDADVLKHPAVEREIAALRARVRELEARVTGGLAGEPRQAYRGEGAAASDEQPRPASPPTIPAPLSYESGEMTPEERARAVAPTVNRLSGLDDTTGIIDCIAAAIRAAVEAEREACTQAVERMTRPEKTSPPTSAIAEAEIERLRARAERAEQERDELREVVDDSMRSEFDAILAKLDHYCRRPTR